MPARNHSQWLAEPPLAKGEWIDSRVYSDQQIFDEELKKIFKHVWVPVCHESELAKPTISARSRSHVSRSWCVVVPTIRCARSSTSARIAEC